jgi:ABC-2 type transport system permease protein
MRRTQQPFLTQLLDLTLIQMTNWRWSWKGGVIVGFLAPTFLIAAFGTFANNDPTVLGYVLTGNVVLSLLLIGLSRVSNHFAFIRAMGTLDYFATLPISRVAFILATVIAFLVLALPSTLATLLLGWLILHVPLQINPLVIVILPLISVSLSGLGALIGLLGNTPDEVNNVSTIVSFILFGFGPVIVPLEKLPDFMRTLSLFSPATYAASALRQVLLGQADRIPMLVGIVVLAVFTVATLWLVTRRLDWRGR